MFKSYLVSFRGGGHGEETATVLASQLADKVSVMYSFPMLGMAVLKAHLAGEGGELLPDVFAGAAKAGADGAAAAGAAMEEVIEACALRPFMDLLSAPCVAQLRELMLAALEAVHDEVGCRGRRGRRGAGDAGMPWVPIVFLRSNQRPPPHPPPIPIPLPSLSSGSPLCGGGAEEARVVRAQVRRQRH